MDSFNEYANILKNWNQVSMFQNSHFTTSFVHYYLLLQEYYMTNKNFTCSNLLQLKKISPWSIYVGQLYMSDSVNENINTRFFYEDNLKSVIWQTVSLNYNYKW